MRAAEVKAINEATKTNSNRILALAILDNAFGSSSNSKVIDLFILLLNEWARNACNL